MPGAHLASPTFVGASRRLRTARSARARQTGASMIEALVVISVFIGFFLGMVYYRSLYERKMRITRLARSAAVAFAMNACPSGGDALAPIKADLGTAKDSSGSPSGSQQGSNQGVQSPSTSNVGQNGGNPVGDAVSGSGFTGDPISIISLQSDASGTTKTSPLTTLGFKSTVHTTSAMSCGDKQQKGDINGALKYVQGEFNYKK